MRTGRADQLPSILLPINHFRAPQSIIGHLQTHTAVFLFCLPLLNISASKLNPAGIGVLSTSLITVGILKESLGSEPFALHFESQIFPVREQIHQVTGTHPTLKSIPIKAAFFFCFLLSWYYYRQHGKI